MYIYIEKALPPLLKLEERVVVAFYSLSSRESEREK